MCGVFHRWRFYPGADFSGFDLRVVCATVALPGHFSEARIDHHALLCQGRSVFFLQVRQKSVEQALEGLHCDEPFAKVADRLAVGHLVPRCEGEEGVVAKPRSEPVAVGDLEAGGIIGQTVQTLQHEHLEHEHGVRARSATRAFGFASEGNMDERIEDLPSHQLAHVHQGGLEGCGIKGLNELIKESRVAEGNEKLPSFCLLHLRAPRHLFDQVRRTF